MKCQNCGYDNPEGSQFCVACGTKLNRPNKVTKKKYRCYVCCGVFEGKLKYCPHCGAKMAWPDNDVDDIELAKLFPSNDPYYTGDKNSKKGKDVANKDIRGLGIITAFVVLICMIGALASLFLPTFNLSPNLGRLDEMQVFLTSNGMSTSYGLMGLFNENMALYGLVCNGSTASIPISIFGIIELEVGEAQILPLFGNAAVIFQYIAAGAGLILIGIGLLNGVIGVIKNIFSGKDANLGISFSSVIGGSLIYYATMILTYYPTKEYYYYVYDQSASRDGLCFTPSLGTGFYIALACAVIGLVMLYIRNSANAKKAKDKSNIVAPVFYIVGAILAIVAIFLGSLGSMQYLVDGSGINILSPIAYIIQSFGPFVSCASTFSEAASDAQFTSVVSVFLYIFLTLVGTLGAGIFAGFSVKGLILGATDKEHKRGVFGVVFGIFAGIFFILIYGMPYLTISSIEGFILQLDTIAGNSSFNYLSGHFAPLMYQLISGILAIVSVVFGVIGKSFSKRVVFPK